MRALPDVIVCVPPPTVISLSPTQAAALHALQSPTAWPAGSCIAVLCDAGYHVTSNGTTCAPDCKTHTYTAVAQDNILSDCGTDSCLGAYGTYSCQAAHYFTDTLPEGSLVRSILLTATGASNCNHGKSNSLNDVTDLPAFDGPGDICWCYDRNAFQAPTLAIQEGISGYSVGATNYIRVGSLCAQGSILTVAVSTCVAE